MALKTTHFISKGNTDRHNIKNLLSIQNLEKSFRIKRNASVYAVRDVTFGIKEKEVVGLVGESGCGKSTIARLILRLLKPTNGTIYLGNKDIFRDNDLGPLSRQVSLIFQDPYTSLNPKMKVGKIVGEPLKVHKMASKNDLQEIVHNLLRDVGINPDYSRRYPHEFSGGQRQRIVIARALALKPKLVICDEPVASLDVSIRSTILNLLSDLQNQFDFSYLYISHDLSTVNYFCDKICVMYLGKIVEMASKGKLFQCPMHPYTQALFSAIPSIDSTARKEVILLKGDIPSPVHIPAGCAFNSRCWMAQPICKEKEPEFLEKEEDHCVACHFV